MSEQAQAIANSILQTTRFLDLEAKFVSLINDKAQLDAQWRSLDFNGNGIVSLAELDKWVVQSFPLLNNKAALRRAFIRTTTRDGDGDDWVQRREFKALLVNVIYFNRAFELFDSIDTGRDQRVDFEEFFAAVGRLGLGLDRKQALAEFQRIDRNGGGQLLFDEFCEWLVEINSFKFKERMRGTAYVESIVNGSSPATAVKQSPVASSPSSQAGSSSRLPGSSSSQPSSHFVSPVARISARGLTSASSTNPSMNIVSPETRVNSSAKISLSSETHPSPNSIDTSFAATIMENRKFMEMEAKFVSLINDKAQLDAQWRSLDFNGNGIVSLAELDKWVVQSFPLLNNKAALRRAFIRTTTRDGDGDDWVQRREFKALLVNVIYFNRAFELFDSIDTGRDQRVDFEEFFAAVGRLGLGLDRKQALAEFQRIDRNGGGQLLFDEFCEWLVEINSFKFKERMRGTAYVESIVNGSSPATAVKQSPVASAGSLPLRANTVLNGSSPKLPSPAPMIRSRALPSPSVGSSASSASPSVGSSISAAAEAAAAAAALAEAAEAAAKAFHRIEAQFVQFISSRDQLISQWSVLDSSSQGFVSFPAFELWLSRHFPDLHNPIALKCAFERLYDPKSGEPARLLFKDFGAILVNVLFFCRAVNAYKDCGLPVDTAVDLRDFQRLLVALNMGVIYAEALAQ
jgi:Ca2+-binding EF-hand superfamily protein